MENKSPSLSLYDLPHSPELQGLRAVAVLSVLIYHIDAQLLPGGFLGVDIFFVLSGFLIGRKLLAELDKTRSINLLRFTAARIKRLLPNALAVLFFTGVASYVFLPPYRLADVGEDIWAAALIHSNIHFADRAIDYMQIGELPSPVLHFWSLSVEEQFYIFLPLLLLSTTLVRRNLRLPLALGLITTTMIVSFFNGLSDLQRSQPDAFFLTQNRIWQLCCGVLSGVVSASYKPKISHSALTLARLSAIVVITVCFCVISSDFGYSGVTALAPTLGASALIISIGFNNNGHLNRILSSPFCQWVGDRSYSIYLWHWPFIAIAAEAYPDSRIVVWMAGLASIIPAALTYELLEQPARKSRWQGNLKLLSLAGVGVAGVATASVGLTSIPQPKETVARAARIEAARLDIGGASVTKCHVDLAGLSSPPCTFGNNENGRIMLIGDSHAAQWFDPIRKAAEQEKWQFIARTKTSCPSLEVSIWYPPKAAIYTECDRWRASVLEEVAAAPPDVIILANYSGYEGWIADNGRPVSRSRAQLLWETALRRLFEKLTPQSQVWIIRDNPRMHPNYRGCLSYSDDCHRSRTLALHRLTDDAEIAKRFGEAVNVIDFTDRFCDKTLCSAVIDGQIAYRDYHHIAGTFSTSFTYDFRTILKHRK